MKISNAAKSKGQPQAEFVWREDGRDGGLSSGRKLATASCVGGKCACERKGWSGQWERSVAAEAACRRDETKTRTGLFGEYCRMAR